MALTVKEKKRMAKRRKSSAKNIESMYKTTKGQEEMMNGLWNLGKNKVKKVA